jgi:fibronectin type 3 domain-containing protein
MHDTFPPRTPTGLAAVPSTDGIDLSWEPNTEPDLAGYIVYRRQVSVTGEAIGTPTRLTSTPTPAPAFSDRTAQPGQSYSYRVTAIDTAGNESPASTEVQESRRVQ